MKRKIVIAILSLSIGISIVACGGNNSTELTDATTTESEDETGPTETITTESEIETAEKEKDNTTATSTNDKIVESESWPDYKKTMEYYVENGILSERNAYMLNPDVYGTELAGQASMKTDTGTGSPDAGIYIKTLDLTTTKGYHIEAFWYTETNTVGYVYCDEALPTGWWFSDMDSMEYLMDNGSCTNSLDMTRQERIELLGEPSMTPEEVIAEITGGKNKYLKRLIITTTKGYKIQAYWNMNDDTVEYVYAGDEAPYGGRSSFLRSAETLALEGKYDAPQEEKRKILGEPSMTDEEVINTLKTNIENGTYMGP